MNVTLALAPTAVAAWFAEPMPEFMLEVLMPPKLAMAPLSIETDPVSTSPSLWPRASTDTCVTKADRSIAVSTLVELLVLLLSDTELELELKLSATATSTLVFVELLELSLLELSELSVVLPIVLPLRLSLTATLVDESVLVELFELSLLELSELST